VAELHVAGTGSFAFEVLEYARAAGHDVVALLELVDPTRIGSEIHGLPVVGLETEPGAAVIGLGGDLIGLGGDRLALWSRLAEHGWRTERVVHPAAVVSPSATVAAGAVVGPGAIVGAATELGRHSFVSRGALVHSHLRFFERDHVASALGIAGDRFRGERMLRAGVRIELVDQVTYDYYPSSLWQQ
jgi:hypothetical protein